MQGVLRPASLRPHPHALRLVALRIAKTRVDHLGRQWLGAHCAAGASTESRKASYKRWNITRTSWYVGRSQSARSPMYSHEQQLGRFTLQTNVKPCRCTKLPRLVVAHVLMNLGVQWTQSWVTTQFSSGRRSFQTWGHKPARKIRANSASARREPSLTTSSTCPSTKRS